MGPISASPTVFFCCVIRPPGASSVSSTPPQALLTRRVSIRTTPNHERGAAGMSGEWVALAGPPLGITFLATLVLSLFATHHVLKRLKRAAILDRPNERSLHDAPTPRGGRIGIFAALLPAWLVNVPVGDNEAVA